MQPRQGTVRASRRSGKGGEVDACAGLVFNACAGAHIELDEIRHLIISGLAEPRVTITADPFTLR